MDCGSQIAYYHVSYGTHSRTLNQILRMDADQKFDYPHTVEMTDGKASSPPQLPWPTVKTCVGLNGSDARSAVYCSLFSVCV